MASSELLQSPSPSRSSSRVFRWTELVFLIAGSALNLLYAVLFYADPEERRSLSPSLDTLEFVRAIEPAGCLLVWCLLVAWLLRGRLSLPPALTDDAAALAALPSGFPFARLSSLPLMARLLRARLEFAPDALAIKWRFGERRISYREIARADWQFDGVVVLFRDGRRLLIPTCRSLLLSTAPPYPELRQAVETATFAVLRHNQNISERIQSECERTGSVGYRRDASRGASAR